MNFLRSTADLAGFLVGNDLAFIWHRISFDFRRLTKIIFYWTKFGKSVHCARRRERVICQNVARLACHLFCSELTLTSTVLHRVIKRLTEPKESEGLSISLSFNFNYFSSSNLLALFMVSQFHPSNLPVHIFNC